MRPRCGFGSIPWVTATTFIVLLPFTRSVHGQQQEETPTERPSIVAEAAVPVPSARTATSPTRIQITDVRLKRTAEIALRFASQRVTANGCRSLLTEFADERGQPLAARLESLQMSLHDYLHTVIFVDGTNLAACQGPMAVTMPGSRVVYLCGRMARQSHSEGWVTIIHETLHSLGLAENPPTPAFISDRVRTLCR